MGTASPPLSTLGVSPFSTVGYYSILSSELDIMRIIAEYLCIVVIFEATA